MKNRLLIFVLLFLGCMVSCSDDPKNELPPLPQEDGFTIEILTTSETSVEFTITPDNEQMTYITMIDTKERFDTFDSEEAYIHDDMLWLEEAAEQQGMNLEAYLVTHLNKGALTDYQEGLLPSTQYVIYAYGLTADAQITSSLYSTSFTTASTQLVDLNFEIKISEIGYTEATITFTPDNERSYYFWNVISEEDYLYYGGDEEVYKEYVIELRNYYLSMGRTTEEMIANLGCAGQQEITVDDLKPGKKYIAFAIGINDEFLANSQPTVKEFETLAVEMVDLSFEVELTTIEYDHIKGTVTPSNDEHPYICSIQTAETLSWIEDEAAFMDAIISDISYTGGIESALRRGTTSLDTEGGLLPETEYIVVCFGYDEAPNTALYTFPFTTKKAEGNPEELTIEFIISDLSHNSVKVTTIPSEGVYYFSSYIESTALDALVEEYGTIEKALIAFANEEIDFGAEYFDCSRAEYLTDMGALLGRYTMLYNQLTPLTEYIAYGIAVDLTTGELASMHPSVSEPYTTTEKIVSDAEVHFEFGKYYDGTALAELDPTNFLACKGYAVMPYKVTPNESATAWYTGFYDGDYSAWATEDDIYDLLITYGYNYDPESVSLNREIGVAVLPYDYPFSFLGIAKNEEGIFGVGTMEVVTLTKDGVSPAEEFIMPTAEARPTKADKRLERVRLPRCR
uniref:hypothetical protein n=1 Tax=Alistipes sp. TaxID=1872444 RepID=UPI004056BAEB